MLIKIGKQAMSYINIWEYTEPLEDGQLAYLSIACTTRCNLDCVYCSKKNSQILDLDPVLLNRTLEEAIDLGLKKVEFTGGEPLLYPFFMEIARRLVERNVTVLMVTNGTLLNLETAKKLADLGVGVGVSLSTLREDRFDGMSQKKGLIQAVFNALQFLRASGYRPDKMPVLAIQSIASRDTLDELEELRNFALEQGCMFIVNRAIPVGGLQASNVPTGKELKVFLDNEFEGSLEACIPFSSDTPCNRLKAGCYIGSDARLRPCPAIDLVVGDLRQQTLTEVWQHAPVLQKCRHIDRWLEGSCGQCPEHHRCYGCRAVAYAVWNSLWAPDPGCFRFAPDEKFNLNRSIQV